MPFTQREIDSVHLLVGEFHGLDRETVVREFGWPPLFGSDIPPGATAEQIAEAIKHRLPHG